ncbi:MAG: hypothetical protein M3R18_09865 [Pseudomonadota bacterium]|nr:hypothetical protein [Pseudomonadota bacterium]
MTEFEFLFSVFGLLIGLTLVEVAVKSPMQSTRIVGDRLASSPRCWRYSC